MGATGHRHPHRRRPRLRVRPSVLQPRPGRVPADARLRLHHPPQPDDVVQDLHLGETIGTMQQDRATAIAGTLGKGPTLIPMTVTHQLDARGRSRRPSSDAEATTWSTISCSRRCSPTSAIFNTLGAYERQFGAATISVKSRARVEGPRRADARRHLHRRQPDARRGSRRWPAPLTMLLGERRRAGHGRGRRHHGHRDGDAAQRDHRARLARRRAAARRDARCRSRC